MIRNQSSVFEASALKCVVSFRFNPSQDSTTQSVGTRKDWVTCFLVTMYHLRSDGIPFSLQFCKLRFYIPLLLVSGAEKTSHVPAETLSRTS